MGFLIVIVDDDDYNDFDLYTAISKLWTKNDPFSGYEKLTETEISFFFK